MSKPQHVGTFHVDLSGSVEEVRASIANIADKLNCSDLDSVRLARVCGLRPVLQVEVALIWPDDEK